LLYALTSDPITVHPSLVGSESSRQSAKSLSMRIFSAAGRDCELSAKIETGDLVFLNVSSQFSYVLATDCTYKAFSVGPSYASNVLSAPDLIKNEHKST
jgi:hypothetical protein